MFGNRLYKAFWFACGAIFLFFPNVALSEPVSEILSKSRWTGTYEAMRARGVVRLAVSYNPSLYYKDQGVVKGLMVEVAKDFSLWLDRKYGSVNDANGIKVVLVPVLSGKSPEAVLNGIADVAVVNVTERLMLSDRYEGLTQVDTSPLSEVLVTNAELANQPKSFADMAGHVVHSSAPVRFRRSLSIENAKLALLDKAPIQVIEENNALTDEDLLQMVDANLLGGVFVDDWKADLWKSALPDIRVHPNIRLIDQGNVGWLVRNNDAQLADDLNRFAHELMAGGRLDRYRKTIFSKQVRSMKDPTQDKLWARFMRLYPTFKKYGRQYNLDPLLLASLGFQESVLDVNVRSGNGAVGIMQILPSTGKHLGVINLRNADANIYAATKYMNQILNTYFSGSRLDKFNRTLFAIAAYNAGPNAISKMAIRAGDEGLDANVWLNNVEIIASDRLGTGVTSYVRNVYKYYVIYNYQLQGIPLR